MRDTIYRDEAIKAIKDHSFALGDDYLEINGYGAIDDIRALPSADRPSGEVDAVKEYERQAHNLEQGYITLGEFDKRVEPLRHLYYDRPQGEWIDEAISIIDDMQREGIVDYQQAWEFRMRARMKGADHEDN